MAFKKKQKKVIEPEIIETSEDKIEEIQEEVENEVEEITENKIVEVEDKKPKAIKKGSKVVVSGRTFGNSLLECPITSVKDYSAKILDIENGNYLIDAGWISPKSLKD